MPNKNPILYFVFLGVIFFASCKTIDLTKEIEIACPIHDVKLKMAIVKTNYGRAIVRDKNNVFPYAKKPKEMGCILPDRIYKRAKIYTCEKCTKEYEKIIKEND